MAIGTAAAIGLGVAGVGSVLSSRSQSKAAGRAADTSMQVANQNNSLARDIYGQNKNILAPYVQRGNAAGETMNALLGLGGAPANTNSIEPTRGMETMSAFGGGPYWNFGGAMAEGREFATQAMPVQSVSAAPQSSAQAANNAFDTYRNSTGYQFRLDEGMNAINSGWAGAGTLQSGAALKSALQFGQNFGSGEFGNFMGYLGNQQGVGLGAGSALAGVGQNYVNTISANNNSAGSAAANAALIKGQNNPFASAFGTIGGGILGYAR